MGTAAEALGLQGLLVCRLMPPADPPAGVPDKCPMNCEEYAMLCARRTSSVWGVSGSSLKPHQAHRTTSGQATLDQSPCVAKALVFLQDPLQRYLLRQDL